MTIADIAEQHKITCHNFLEYALRHDFGDIHFKVDPKTGMQAIIAIHSTKLGPALGGCRFIEYHNLEQAIADAMRLARGMSYKAASVNLPLGGGKGVILKPKTAFNRQAYFHAYGEFVNELSGRYITALDSGTELSDMDIIGEKTPYVASLSQDHGDPSPYTAKGLILGIEAAVAFKLNKHTLAGLHIAIQGLGHVGYNLATTLHALGAQLTVADIDPQRTAAIAKACDATIVPCDQIHSIACDVFAPCALGAVVNDNSINQFNTTIIAGAANNQLAHRYHGELLHRKNILYVPDYIISAGGLIFAANKYLKTHTDIDLQLQNIQTALMEIFTIAQQENISTSIIADRLAQAKLA